ncbi:hypothetical protein GCK72_016287 [Caenorhabditis remanei]|uniref:Uncharacterized protein n=1 Tax=Caenorhabditis remanei TaxID=31234 RepID=A0A6A5GWG8_CAERE|nr:hypothetical protein GCK72_016287 [Caenorhabditis remanei]KAF1759820.1 hypothetical protein GCK72_016287 [Caenorhabditis remanei]
MLKQFFVFLAIYVACSIAEEEFHVTPAQAKKELAKLGMEKKYIDEFVAMDDEHEKKYAELSNDPLHSKRL